MKLMAMDASSISLPRPDKTPLKTLQSYSFKEQDVVSFNFHKVNGYRDREKGSLVAPKFGSLIGLAFLVGAGIAWGILQSQSRTKKPKPLPPPDIDALKANPIAQNKAFVRSLVDEILGRNHEAQGTQTVAMAFGLELLRLPLGKLAMMAMAEEKGYTLEQINTFYEQGRRLDPKLAADGTVNQGLSFMSLLKIMETMGYTYNEQ